MIPSTVARVSSSSFFPSFSLRVAFFQETLRNQLLAANSCYWILRILIHHCEQDFLYLAISHSQISFRCSCLHSRNVEVLSNSSLLGHFYLFPFFSVDIGNHLGKKWVLNKLTWLLELLIVIFTLVKGRFIVTSSNKFSWYTTVTSNYSGRVKLKDKNVPDSITTKESFNL